MFKRPIFVLLVILILSIVFVDSFLPTVFLSNHYIKHLPQTQTFKYLITDSPKQTPKTYSYTAKIISYYDPATSKWESTKGKIKIYIPQKDSANKENKILQYGDVIVSSDNLQPIRNFDSLSSFNYVRYMRRQRIYHQVFIHKFELIDSNKGNKFISYAKKTNLLLKNRIQQTTMGKEQKNIAVALLLGDKRDLDKEIRQQFNTSGLAHILCVSGLHIMLIVFAVSSLLKYILPCTETFVYIRNIITVILCWVIAFVVGLTPSALRVATMLSVLTLSKFTYLNDDRCNVLAVTAFVFLVIDPLLLFNISFQLSFLAVLGLLTLFPFVYNKVKLRYKHPFKWINPLLANISATTSAQILCLPVIIINFSRFPILFLVSNLIVIPLMQIILVSLIVMLVVSDIPLVNNCVNWLCNFELSFLLNTAAVTDRITSWIFRL